MTLDYLIIDNNILRSEIGFIMRSLLSVLLATSTLFAGDVCAAPEHSWIVVSLVPDAKHPSSSHLRRLMLRDDGKVRRGAVPEVPTADYRVFSPDGKWWLEQKYDSGASVANSIQYLLVGTKNESDKNKKPFPQGVSGVDGTNILCVDDASWTRDSNILLSSGGVDWSAGMQQFAYSIVSPSSGKEVVDLKPFREGLFPAAKYERYGKVTSDGERLIFEAEATSFGSESSFYNRDYNAYLVCFQLDSPRMSKILGAFRSIGSLQWNLAGTKCVFSASTGYNANAKTLCSNIYVCSHSKEGDLVSPITFSAFNNSSPVWSSDGKSIAWLSNRPLKGGGKVGENHIYVMKEDGTQQKLLAPDLNIDSLEWHKEEPI